MITMDEVLSHENINLAFEHFTKKKNGSGPDGMPLEELKEYWKMNHSWLIQELKEGTYHPGMIKSYEILNGKGKRRTVYSLNVVDRFVARLLAQKMKEIFDPAFLSSSYAYREGKSPQMAVMQAVQFIGQGCRYVAEIDLQDFFDQIPLEPLFHLLKRKISDQAVLILLERFLYCSVINGNQVIEQRKRGLLQGNPLSPVLSNLYLDQLDQYCECHQYHWIRFADNINIYSCTQEMASVIFTELGDYLNSELGMTINKNKSGIYDALTRRFLGYEFTKKEEEILVKKHQYCKLERYRNWQPCTVERIHREYHIIQNGVLNRQDYALLFENDEEKHHIPVEALEQLNIYGNVSVAASVLNTLSKEKIRLAYMDKHGELLGYYVPEGYTQSSLTLLRQCEKYSDIGQRTYMAREMELAGIHNMRANLRYYYKKKKELASMVEQMTKYYRQMKEQGSVDNMLLVEARAKQLYYLSFQYIIEAEDFCFTKRSRRPPEDPINALISFGNTVLYNRILSMLWKTSLDPRISVVHAANRRAHSLNLDFADIFKPITVDRVIFSLINCRRLRVKEHFEVAEKGGTYLNEDGKRIFLSEFEKKMYTSFYKNNKMYTYHHLIEDEIQNYLRYILHDEKYKPYKYY